MVRDNSWLLSRLDHIWSSYFSDVSQINPVFIKFGRFAKFRFGSIRMDKKSGKTFIVITGMFKDLKVPMAVVDHTIAHELAHYTHGFSSPRKRLHKFPHEGGIVKYELENRGLIHLVQAYREWIKVYRRQLQKYYG